MKQAAEWLATLVFIVVMLYLFENTITDPNYQQGYTARVQAQQQTKQVEAQEWGATVRGTVPWLAGGLAVAAVFGVGGWAVVEWQRQRTRRAELYEVNTTARHMISAKKDIALAWIAEFGTPGAKPGQLGGVNGVFLPATNEFVPIDVCRAELDARRLLTVEVDA